MEHSDDKKAKKPLFSNSAIYGLKQDTLSFSGKKESLYDDFMQKAKVAYPDVPIEKICEDILVDKSKIIGSGAFKDVYSMPMLDEYVLGCKRDEYHSRHAFEKSKMPFEKYYFGDPIATNNADLTIMKKVKGKSHSISDWNYVINDIVYERRELGKDEAKLFLQKITDASNEIIEKCKKACAVVGLGDDSQVVLNTAFFVRANSYVLF